MEKMGSFRTNWRWLRLALAGLLAVVSLVQMPSMVMAWSGSGDTYHEHSVSSHSQHSTLQSSHQHHATHITEDAFQVDGDAHVLFACHVVCCCLTLSAVVCCAPSAFEKLVGLLDAAAAPVMVPVPQDPADPPPRFLS
jgi:hypothetical protein